MIFYPNEKIGVFIDGANLFATARSLNMEIDYKKLKTFFAEKGRLIRIFYYTAMIDDADYSPLRPLIDWLDYNGYTLVTKPIKEFTDDQGRRKVKGNMDIEIAVDMLALSENLDHVVLFSGDGDFRRLIEAIQRKGVRVTIISSNSTQPSMIADELRRQADQYVDLAKIRDDFARPRSQNPQQAQSIENDDFDEDGEYYEDDDDYEDDPQ
ncbi:NYN domain-containing protein [Iodidimonas nitroreducens]|uniref:NYN domain-containing protein n=1 Tax=Iodidimonas nitroreducens TaxID=1236968 RepID=A0A5A7N882_9PROT|nr:NYN domain-containing protein [Iodidimonas nitroreducens]GAK32545.1 NYN domain protein [alpha proteobacterium Q-1]GER04563.1 NYN domain-containing protein [Iodidimonas nitroreducens]